MRQELRKLIGRMIAIMGAAFWYNDPDSLAQRYNWWNRMINSR